MDDDGLMSFFSEVENNDIDLGGNYFEYDTLWEHLWQDNNIAGIENIDVNNLEYSGTTDCNATNVCQTKTIEPEERPTAYQNSLTNYYAEHDLKSDNVLSSQSGHNLMTKNDEIEVALQGYSGCENVVTVEHNSLTDNTAKEDLECDDSPAPDNRLQTHEAKQIEHDNQGDFECLFTLTSGENLLADSASTENKEIDCPDRHDSLTVCQNSQVENAEREEGNHNNNTNDENFIHDSPEVDRELLIDELEESTNDQSSLDDQRSVEANHETDSGIEGLLFEIKGVAEEDLFICEICHHVFHSEYKREIHHLKKHCVPEEKPSDVETHKMSLLPDIQLLARRVNGKKMYFCCVCSFKTKQYASMFRHITRVHDNGRFYNTPIYLCEVCGKTFKDKNYFKIHGKSHGSELRYVCEVCGKSISSWQSLSRHKQGHSDEKNICCKLCDFKTNRKVLMYTHAELHRKGAGLKCRFCGEMFFTKLALRRHNYANGATFPCSVCRVGFSSKLKALKHERDNHNSTDD